MSTCTLWVFAITHSNNSPQVLCYFRSVYHSSPPPPIPLSCCSQTDEASPRRRTVARVRSTTALCGKLVSVLATITPGLRQGGRGGHSAVSWSVEEKPRSSITVDADGRVSVCPGCRADAHAVAGGHKLEKSSGGGVWCSVFFFLPLLRASVSSGSEPGTDPQTCPK